MSRRVGLRRRRPPAAGWGRLAIPRGGQRRKRPALGEPFSPGMSGIHAAPIFAAAGRWLMKVSSRANAIVSTTARAARSEAERAEREAGQMRSCTPTPSAPSATGRQYRPHRRPKRARMPGKIGAGTGTPTPVRAEGHCTGARPAPFSLTPGAARSLFGATKKRMGAHCPAGTPAESPGRLITAPTVLQGSGGNPAGGHTVPPLPLPADQLIQRQVVEIRQGNQCGQGRFPQTQLIVLIGAPTDSNFHRKSLLTQVSCCSQLKKMFRKCHGHPLFS